MKDIATKDRILKAARAVFVEKGRDGARMQEIAERAGVNKALLHYYFTSKELLYREVFTAAFSELAGSFSFIKDEDMPLEEQIRQFVGLHFDFIARNPELLILIAQETTRKDTILGDILSEITSNPAFEIRNVLFAALQKAVQEGRIRPCDPVQFILNVISMNVFYFIVRPLITAIFPEIERDHDAFLKARREAIIDAVIRSLDIH